MMISFFPNIYIEVFLISFVCHLGNHCRNSKDLRKSPATMGVKCNKPKWTPIGFLVSFKSSVKSNRRYQEHFENLNVYPR